METYVSDMFVQIAEELIDNQKKLVDIDNDKELVDIDNEIGTESAEAEAVEVGLLAYGE